MNNKLDLLSVAELFVELHSIVVLFWSSLGLRLVVVNNKGLLLLSI